MEVIIVASGSNGRSASCKPAVEALVQFHSKAVNIFPGLDLSLRKLAWRDTYDVAISFVQLLHTKGLRCPGTTRSRTTGGCRLHTTVLRG